VPAPRAGSKSSPGVTATPARGAGTLRFSYARATADIEEGLARLERFMAAR
jgi:aspartate/methionine/tyrosine aminotransferase